MMAYRTERDLVVVFGLIWLASAVRVGAALVLHERFGAVASLALLAVVSLPFLLKRP